MPLTIFDKTNLDLLISNLRGEIGEIIETWTLYRELEIICLSLKTNDFEIDLKNQELLKNEVLKKKLKNDIISSLSELAEKKYGQINFHFACKKLNSFENECKNFENYILKNNIRLQRHEFISHKKSPPTHEEFKTPYRIKYIVILKALAKALILMKMIDSIHLGPHYKALWLETRKRRYDYSMPGKGKYMLLPYLNLKSK